jgi:poly(beta-D-mannuronate) lyase
VLCLPGSDGWLFLTLPPKTRMERNYKMSFLRITLITLMLVNILNAADYYVTSAEEISSTMAFAQPGDTLTMANGVWQDSYIIFSGNGEEGNPILLRAEMPGFVNLTGTARLRIAGSYLVVDGLRFINGYSNSGAVIEFRNGTGSLANNCRLTNTVIINYNPESVSSEYKWVSIYGTYNEVDHCYFKGKQNYGALLVVWRNFPTPDYHHIHHNYFLDRPLTVNDNGFETIRIGTSTLSLSDSYSVIESNYFEACNGEIEIISNKSGENIYRYNTFYNCEGTLTLRHGNKCKVYGNYFDGNGNSRSGGIRVIGEDHIIYNNYFTQLGGNGNRSALSIENGVPNSLLNRYFQVINAQILYNTFTENYRNITIGTGADSERSLPPLDCTIGNNVVHGTSSPLIDEDDEPVNLSWLSNIFYGASLGITQPEGITITDPLLILGEDGLWRPTENSPVKDAGEESYVFITDDFDGQSRLEGEYDIGSDEISAEAIQRRPVTPDSVGPEWLNNPLIPKVLAITIEGDGSVVLDPAGGLYEVGTWVNLTAVPDEEWTFSEWGGELTGTNMTDSIYMDIDKTVIARFNPPVFYQITPWIVGTGRLEYDPPGNSYAPGTVVWVMAIPDSGWIFDSWGGALNGKENPDSLIMDADKGVMATFANITLIRGTKLKNRYQLAQNYPNPFNPVTHIAFSIAKTGDSMIEIYNSVGHKVDTILDQILYPGEYKIRYNASHLASGIYYYRLRTGSYTQIKKMILIK